MKKKTVLLFILMGFGIIIVFLGCAQVAYLNHLNEVTQLQVCGIYDRNKWILSIAQDYERGFCSIGVVIGLALSVVSGALL